MEVPFPPTIAFVVGASAAAWDLTWRQGICYSVGMDAVVEQGTLFPFASTERRSKFREMMEAFDRHGYMLPRAHIPVVLDVSRQRVKELIDEGRIATVWVQDREFVPLASLEIYLADERKAGRPVHELSLGDAYSRHVFEPLKKLLRK